MRGGLGLQRRPFSESSTMRQSGQGVKKLPSKARSTTLVLNAVGMSQLSDSFIQRPAQICAVATCQISCRIRRFLNGEAGCRLGYEHVQEVFQRGLLRKPFTLARGVSRLRHRVSRVGRSPVSLGTARHFSQRTKRWTTKFCTCDRWRNAPNWV